MAGRAAPGTVAPTAATVACRAVAPLRDDNKEGVLWNTLPRGSTISPGKPGEGARDRDGHAVSPGSTGLATGYWVLLTPSK